MRRRWARLIVAIGVITAAAVAVIAFAVRADPAPSAPQQELFTLPTSPDSYVGLYPDGVPSSYAGVTAFTTATGVRPSVVPYYSGWLEPFQTRFATTAAERGAVPLVQMDPTHISVPAIASGKYDTYLSAYAEAGPRLPPPGNRELWAPDEWLLVLVGQHSYGP